MRGGFCVCLEGNTIRLDKREEIWIEHYRTTTGVRSQREGYTIKNP